MKQLITALALAFAASASFAASHAAAAPATPAAPAPELAGASNRYTRSAETFTRKTFHRLGCSA